MARIARMVVKDEPAVYHVMSRTALDGFVLGDVEKEYMLELIKGLSSIYFTEVLGFCVMGNHFHLLLKMHPGEDYSDDEIKRRFEGYYGKGSEPGADQIGLLRRKWGTLSEFVKEAKQGFSRFYNRLHNRRGFFWGGRFKSVIVEKGETLINCLAYVDLNGVRAGIVEKPEDYRWCSLGYHVQTNNRDGFLSLDFGLKEFGVMDEKERLRSYRRFVYQQGHIDVSKRKRITTGILEREREKGFEMSTADRFRYRTRYFTDSVIIGSKGFVSGIYQEFKGYFSSRHEKRPKAVRGLKGVYSLKRLYGEG